MTSATLADLTALAAPMLGGRVERATPMPGGGSRRAFHRLSGPAGSAVGVIGEDMDEVRAFLGFTRHFAARNLPVPRILAEDMPRGMYLMEDLGAYNMAESLAQWRREPGGEARAAKALKEVVQWLPAFQVRGGEVLDGLSPADADALDGTVFRGDLRRFLTHFLPRFVLRPPPVTDAVQSDLEALVARLDALPREHFCYRDFQTRNIMWVRREGREGPVFLDYQSGRRGALAYDLTSLLHSPETGADEGLRERLIDVYLDSLAECGVALAREDFLADFYPVVLIRRLQALGAYAELGVTRNRADYLERIPPAVSDLRALLEAGRFDFGLPALKRWLEEVLGD
ncbi:MAG: phosphotransferase [bacterium]